MKKTAALLLFLLLGSQTALATDDCTTPGHDVLRSIVRIAGDDGSNGSGVVIGKDRVLTAAHVLDEAKTAYIGYDGSYKEAQLLLVDEENDLALLEAPTRDLPVLPIGTQEMAVEAKVWAIGYPRAGALTMTPGILENDDGATLHTTAEIDSGDSGGGLIACEEGRHVLAGMLRGYGAIKRGEEYVKIANYSASVAARNISEFILISRILASNQAKLER